MGGYLNLGFYADQFSITAFAAKTDNTVRGGKQRIIIRATYINTGMDFSTALFQDNGSGQNRLPITNFQPQIFCI